MSESPAITRRQWMILLIAWLGWLFDIADTALFNFAKGPMLIEMMGAAQYKLAGPAIEGRIQALFLLGWGIGGLFFGILADKIGRTRTLVITVLWYAIFTGITAFCRNPEQVAAVRFLTALGIGGEWAAGAALVAESFDNTWRARAAAMLQSAAAFGPALAAGVNFALRDSGWQFLFLVGVLPAVMCVFVRRSVHEPTSRVQADKAPISAIFGHSRWRRHALAGMAVGAVTVAGAQTATFWLPNLIRAASVGVSPSELASRTSSITMISHVGTLAGVFAAPLLANVFGRRWVTAAFFIAAPVAVGLAVGGGAEYERLMLLMPVVYFFSIGVSGIAALYFPELFPSSVRATGAGLAYNVGRVVAIPMPIVTGEIAKAYGGSIATAVLLSAGVYLLGVMALPFLPETKGRPLPEDE